MRRPVPTSLYCPVPPQPNRTATALQAGLYDEDNDLEVVLRRGEDAEGNPPKPPNELEKRRMAAALWPTCPDGKVRMCGVVGCVSEGC